MIKFGDKVVIIDPALKSYNRVGVFLGDTYRNLVKVYLEKPINNGKRTVALVSVSKDKIVPYEQNPLEQKRIQLEQVYERMYKIKNEFDQLTQQAYKLEMEIVEEQRGSEVNEI